MILGWLNQTLCGKESKVEPDTAFKDAFVEIFKKYGGEKAGKKARELLDVACYI